MICLIAVFFLLIWEEADNRYNLGGYWITHGKTNITEVLYKMKHPQLQIIFTSIIVLYIMLKIS